MKKLAFIVLIIFPLIVHSQNFAPVGAEWHYTENHAFSGHISFLHIISVKDTIVKGETCSILQSNRGLACNFYEEQYLVYEEDSVVYFYSPVVDEFQVLYDLRAKKDSSWIVVYQVADFLTDTVEVIIDSVKTIDINGHELLAFEVTYISLNSAFPFDDYQSTIIERIGDQYYLFNFLALAEGIICDGNYSGGLRCYQDQFLGFYSTGIADSCTYVTGIIEQSKSDRFKIFPNPFTTSTTIEYHLDQATEVTISIFNHLGELVKQIQENQQKGKHQFIWNAEGLPVGMYFFTLQSGEKRSYGKVLLTR